MASRWFVEVSPVDADTHKERYCIEAPQWQQALQQARKLRGERSPLSSFSVELLSEGYRAVDASVRLRYVVSRAPPNAALSQSKVPILAIRPVSVTPTSTRPVGQPETDAGWDSPAAPADVRGGATAGDRPTPVPPAAAAKEGTASKPPSHGLARLVISREEEPTPAVPMVYREYAYALHQKLSELALRALLLRLLEQAKRTLAHYSERKFVQFAIFDHVFVERPQGPPVAVLVWKDWRGEPAIAVHGSQPPKAAPVAPKAPEPPRQVRPASEPPPPQALPRDEPVRPSPANPSDLEVSSVRRRRGEDLVGELFDRMHELQYARDVVTGAEFIIEVLHELLPCEGVLLHVFDINKNEFVVVRATGPRFRDTLLCRTADSDPLFREAFRRTSTVHLSDARREDRYRAEPWNKLGIEVREGLCGPVQQGGRYLGVIELANPAGGEPFSDSEINALDYICEQFADFIAKRPVVLDHEVVLSV